MKKIKAPQVVLVVDDKVSNASIRSLKVDIIEIRVDNFLRMDIDYVQSQIAHRKLVGLPILLTIRNQVNEGASAPLLTNQEKLSLFALCLKHVEMVDIEFSSPLCAPVMVLAKRAGVKVIVSAHFFKHTPAQLKTLYAKMHALKPNWVKIAVMPKMVNDVWRLVDLAREAKGGFIGIAMGEMGKLSRLFLPLAGSAFTYTFIGQSKAPGQIDAKTLNEHLKFYYL